MEAGRPENKAHSILGKQGGRSPFGGAKSFGGKSAQLVAVRLWRLACAHDHTEAAGPKELTIRIARRVLFISEWPISMTNIENMRISHRLVYSYIKVARLDAETPSEKAAVAEALALADFEFPPSRAKTRSLGALTKSESLRYESFLMLEHADTIKGSSAEKDVASWKMLIIKELHIALCSRSKKYAKYVTALKENANLLIGAVAGWLAHSARIAVAAATVIAALVAAVLKFVLALGVGVFCERWSPK